MNIDHKGASHPQGEEYPDSSDKTNRAFKGSRCAGIETYGSAEGRPNMPEERAYIDGTRGLSNSGNMEGGEYRKHGRGINGGVEHGKRDGFVQNVGNNVEKRLMDGSNMSNGRNNRGRTNSKSKGSHGSFREGSAENRNGGAQNEDRGNYSGVYSGSIQDEMYSMNRMEEGSGNVSGGKRRTLQPGGMHEGNTSAGNHLGQGSNREKTVEGGIGTGMMQSKGNALIPLLQNPSDGYYHGQPTQKVHGNMQTSLISGGHQQPFNGYQNDHTWKDHRSAVLSSGNNNSSPQHEAPFPAPPASQQPPSSMARNAATTPHYTHSSGNSPTTAENQNSNSHSLSCSPPYASPRPLYGNHRAYATRPITEKVPVQAHPSDGMYSYQIYPPVYTFAAAGMPSRTAAFPYGARLGDNHNEYASAEGNPPIPLVPHTGGQAFYAHPFLSNNYDCIHYGDVSGGHQMLLNVIQPPMGYPYGTGNSATALIPNYSVRYMRDSQRPTVDEREPESRNNIEGSQGGQTTADLSNENSGEHATSSTVNGIDDPSGFTVYCGCMNLDKQDESVFNIYSLYEE